MWKEERPDRSGGNTSVTRLCSEKASNWSQLHKKSDPILTYHEIFGSTFRWSKFDKCRFTLLNITVTRLAPFHYIRRQLFVESANLFTLLITVAGFKLMDLQWNTSTIMMDCWEKKSSLVAFWKKLNQKNVVYWRTMQRVKMGIFLFLSYRENNKALKAQKALKSIDQCDQALVSFLREEGAKCGHIIHLNCLKFMQSVTNNNFIQTAIKIEREPPLVITRRKRLG